MPGRKSTQFKTDATGSEVGSDRSAALRFVVLIGILGLFADCTYEGSRSIVGPFLATLQANAFTVGVVAGLGELPRYGLRLVSGRLADRTRQFWPITIVGYIAQRSSVPLLALAGNWPVSAALIIVERVGKATRNPPRDVMLSHAVSQVGGLGWAFGPHEAFDQHGRAPLAVVVSDLHRYDRTDTGKGLGHHGDQGTISEPHDMQGVDGIEKRSRLLGSDTGVLPTLTTYVAAQFYCGCRDFIPTFRLHGPAGVGRAPENKRSWADSPGIAPR